MRRNVAHPTEKQRKQMAIKTLILTLAIPAIIAGTVQGDFERNNTFEYLGVRARMEKRDGGFSMTFTFADGRTQVYPIERTVGSRRIEQYVTNQNGQYIPLPLAYD